MHLSVHLLRHPLSHPLAIFLSNIEGGFCAPKVTSYFAFNLVELKFTIN